MEKRKPGQPKKNDAKIKITFRLHPDVVAIIKRQKNQSKFIEEIISKTS